MGSTSLKSAPQQDRQTLKKFDDPESVYPLRAVAAASSECRSAYNPSAHRSTRHPHAPEVPDPYESRPHGSGRDAHRCV